METAPHRTSRDHFVGTEATRVNTLLPTTAFPPTSQMRKLRHCQTPFSLWKTGWENQRPQAKPHFLLPERHLAWLGPWDLHRLKVRYAGSSHVHQDPGLSTELRSAPHQSVLVTMPVLAASRLFLAHLLALLGCFLCARVLSKCVTSPQPPR